MEAPEATFDLAGARRESYARPGALPDVELGASLDEDLARRDFTVNAIALHLADGELTFHAGAREDLDARRLRVLHDASFRDDPTRLLRLARYAARLGFEPEPRTDALAAAAVAGGALETVTGSRLGAELRLLAREPQPAALAALQRHGLGQALLGPGFDVDPDLVARAVALTPRDGDAGLAALATALLGADDIAATLDRLAFPAYERETVAAAADGVPRCATARTSSCGAGSGTPGRRPWRWPARSATCGRAALARRGSPPAAGDHRPRHRRRRARGPAVGAALDGGDGGDARRPCARPRGAARGGARRSPGLALPPHGDRDPAPAGRPVPLGGRAHGRGAAGRPGPVHDPPRRRLRRRVRVAEPRPQDRRRRRERRREPRPRRGGDRLPARAVPVRPPGPRDDRAARHRAAWPGPAARATRTGRRPRCAAIRRSSSSPTARRCCWLPTAPSRRCTWAGGPPPAGSSREGVAALRELGGAGPVTALIGPGARACCYEVGEEVHAAFARLRRPSRRAQPRPPGRDPRPARRGGRARRARHRPVHDVLVRPVLLPSARRRRDRPPGGDRVASLITGIDAGRVRANLERIRGELPPEVADPGRGQVRAARGARHARRGGRRRSPARTARRSSRPRPPAHAGASAGTSSASSRAARSSRSCRTWS